MSGTRFMQPVGKMHPKWSSGIRAQAAILILEKMVLAAAP